MASNEFLGNVVARAEFDDEMATATAAGAGRKIRMQVDSPP